MACYGAFGLGQLAVFFLVDLVLVGASVGFSVRLVGGSRSVLFGVVASVLSVLSLVLGHFVLAGKIAAKDPSGGMSSVDTWASMLQDPGTAVAFFRTYSRWLDIALYMMVAAIGYYSAALATMNPIRRR